MRKFKVPNTYVIIALIIPNMLIDVEDALKYVYTHADDYHVDTAKIGVMGFSAGGHLTMSSYIYNHTPYKPHFLCPVYPVVSMSHPVSHPRSRRGALGVWRQYDKQWCDSLSIEKHIPADCPEYGRYIQFPKSLKTRLHLEAVIQG